MQTRIVDEALVALIGAEDEDEVYAAVVAAVHALLPDSVVVNTALDPAARTFSVNCTAGLDSYLGPIRKLVGWDPTAITYDLVDLRPSDLEHYRSGRLLPIEGGVHALSLGKLPRPACVAIERLLGVRGVYVIGYAWGDLHYGTLSLGICRGDSVAHNKTIEALVHQATIAIRRLRAEEELRAQRAQLDSFFTQSLDLLCIADGRGYLRRLNQEWERTLGYALDELEGRSLLELVHPDDVDATLAAVDRLTRGQPKTKFVNRVRTKDGAYRWLEWRSFPRGELIYAAARDLTDRVEAEQALRDSEQRFRLIADNTADVIWLMDPATSRFTYVSPSVERLRGYTPREVMRQPVEAALTPESFRIVREGIPPRIAAVEGGGDRGSVHVDEIDQPHRDGSVVPTEVTTVFLTDADSKVVEILGVSRDISERRRAEAEIKALNESLEGRVLERTAQLEEAIAELEAFSYSVSHDLRSPLRAINGYATILTADHGAALGDDGRALCDNIIANTRKMGQLIDDLLAFARLGRTQLAAEPVDMRALVDDVLAAAPGDGATHFIVGPLAPALGDGGLLRQVWVNLIDNAVKFSAGQPSPVVEVTCLQDGDEMVYTVKDNGAGFDMQYAGKLFQVFERLHPGEYGGSGIGLAIVRRAVEAHGGRVWGEGEPGGGAAFSFALPRAEAAGG